MRITGGCYCRQVRYTAEGEPTLRAQCHCRECQYVTGGHPNAFMLMPADGFRLDQGQTKGFTRTDIPDAVTREFCPNCGTQILTRSPKRPGSVILKVGSMDDPAQYGKPTVAIFLCDKQAFHQVPEGIPTFDKRPG